MSVSVHHPDKVWDTTANLSLGERFPAVLGDSVGHWRYVARRTDPHLEDMSMPREAIRITRSTSLIYTMPSSLPPLAAALTMTPGLLT